MPAPRPLSDLPPELFLEIIRTCTTYTSFGPVLSLRLVCSAFNKGIVQALTDSEVLDSDWWYRRIADHMPNVVTASLVRKVIKTRRRTHPFDVISQTAHDLSLKVGGLPMYYIRFLCEAILEKNKRLTDHILNGSVPALNQRNCSRDENLLAAAALRGDYPLVESLILTGVKDARTYFGSGLQNAAQNGDYEMFHLLLERGWPTRVILADTLRQAAASNHIDILAILYSSKYAISFPTKHSLAALEAAASNGHEDTLQFLFQHDPMIDIHSHIRVFDPIPNTDLIESHLLFHAAYNNQADLVSRCFANGADCYVQARDDSFNLVRHIVRLGYLDVLRAFLTQGSYSIHHPSYETPLQTALEHGWLDIAELLIEHGAPTNAQYYIDRAEERFWARYTLGRCPLYLAVVRGDADLVILLLENGADVPREKGVVERWLEDGRGDREVRGILERWDGEGD